MYRREQMQAGEYGGKCLHTFQNLSTFHKCQLSNDFYIRYITYALIQCKHMMVIEGSREGMCFRL